MSDVQVAIAEAKDFFESVTQRTSVAKFLASGWDDSEDSFEENLRKSFDMLNVKAAGLVTVADDTMLKSGEPVFWFTMHFTAILVCPLSLSKSQHHC